jgi:hypothetical protein
LRVGGGERRGGEGIGRRGGGFVWLCEGLVALLRGFGGFGRHDCERGVEDGADAQPRAQPAAGGGRGARAAVRGRGGESPPPRRGERRAGDDVRAHRGGGRGRRCGGVVADRVRSGRVAFNPGFFPLPRRWSHLCDAIHASGPPPLGFRVVARLQFEFSEF